MIWKALGRRDFAQLHLKGLPEDLRSLSGRELDSLCVRAYKTYRRIMAGIDCRGNSKLEFELNHILRPEIYKANFHMAISHAAWMPEREGSIGLDVGGSAGLKTALLRHFGIVRVVGVDVVPALIEAAHIWSQQVRADGFEFLLNNGGDLPVETERFDWITAMGLYANLNEAVVQRLFSECHRVLRPGGMLLLNDSANPHHRETREAMQQHHYTMEIGKGSIEEPDGPLFHARKAFILEEYPDLSDPAAERLARGTCYLDRDEVRSAVRRYQEEGVFPNSLFNAADATRAPLRIDGQPSRRPTDPFRIREELQSCGFKVAFRRPGLGGLLEEHEWQDYFEQHPGVFVVAQKPMKTTCAKAQNV